MRLTVTVSADADADAVRSLARWSRNDPDLRGVRITLLARPVRPGEMGGDADALEFVLDEAETVAAVAATLRTWLQTRRVPTTIQITHGDRTFVIGSEDLDLLNALSSRTTTRVEDRDSPAEAEPDDDPGQESGHDSGRDDRLERFLVGEAPAQVRAGDEFSLVARILVRRPGAGEPSAAMTGLAVGADGADVVLLVHLDAGLAGTDRLQATVHVPYRSGSSPVRFPLRAMREGLRRIRLSAWLGGSQLAEVELAVSAEEGRGGRAGERDQRQFAPIGPLRAAPGELTMQVGFDGERYSFQIISPRLISEPVLARSLTASPDAAVERTVEMLRRFATPGRGFGEANPYSPANSRRWVEETGVGLWQDLVPDPIKEAFWELRDGIGAFTIVCPDDRVPWELLYPLSPTEDHGFLAQQFPVLRRVAGQLSAPGLALRDASFVVPPHSPPNAPAEVERLREILSQSGSGAISQLDDLLELVDRGVPAGMLHFACHNTFSLGQGGSSIVMDGGPFRPEMLNRAVTRRSLRASHPLVFVNACRSAGAAPEYTRMMSWASQFMKAGAGAFVGTLWPVNSVRAAEFAEVFYAELAAGGTLGAATMRARAETVDNADPTWLAYSAYGDPAAVAA